MAARPNKTPVAGGATVQKISEEQARRETTKKGLGIPSIRTLRRPWKLKGLVKARMYM